MLVLLDTDHLSILQMRNQPYCDRLESRLSQHPSGDVAACIVSFQENVQGWLAWINKAKKDAQIFEGYRQLQSAFREFGLMRMLPFDAASQAIFSSLRSKHRRIGTLDLRIAIALAFQATLLTRNAQDFAGISGLRTDDWTR